MDAETPTGQTPLHMAAANGHDAVVQCLLQHGASINHSDNQLGYTALHYAVSQARAALVPLLVQHGADGECSSLSRACPPVLHRHDVAYAMQPTLPRTTRRVTCCNSEEYGVLGTQCMPPISSERHPCMKRPTGARMRARWLR